MYKKIENYISKPVKFAGLEIIYWQSLALSFLLFNMFPGALKTIIILLIEYLFFRYLSKKDQPDYLMSVFVWIKQNKDLSIHNNEPNIPFLKDPK